MDPVLSLPREAAQLFGRAPLKAAHRLHELALFDDAALIELLDRMPRDQLFALTMGDDPTRPDERRPASHENVSGAQLLEAVKRGRLWLNVTRVDGFEPKYRALLDALFADLTRGVPGLQVDGRRATLLISSPGAQVYYHADGAPTVLWHLRGRKRLYIYPAGDERFASREALEEIFAGVRTEYLPYQPDFDRHGVYFDLEPGELASWPQNAPHRVVNLDGLNVSLSSEYFTPESRRKARLFTANRFLRRTLRLKNLSANPDSLFLAPKAAAHRLGQALGLDVHNTRRHVPVVRVDPGAPLGVAPLDPPTPAGPSEANPVRSAGRTLSVACATRLEEVRPFREALDDINAQSRAPDGFSTFAFLESFLAEKPDTQLRFLTVRDGEQFLGYLALRRTSERFLGGAHEKLEFLAARGIDAPRLVCRRGDEARCAEAIYRHLLSRGQDWSMVEFRQQYEDSPLLRVPAGVGEVRHRVRLFESKENATIPVARFDSLAAFHKACSKKHRNNVSRSVRQLLGKGELEHVSSDDPAVTPALLELYATIEPRSWKDRAGETISRHEEQTAFFRRLLAPDQPMRISVELVLLDKIPIAGLINGAFGKTLYALHIVHDEALSDSSPGTTALLLGVRRAIEGGFTGYNLLSGFNYYKSRWLAESRPSQSVQLFRVGKGHDWKARLGDLRRRLFPRRAAAAGFNPVKRELAEAASGTAASPSVTAADRRRIAALLGAVSRERAAWLSAEHLRQIMPFETREGMVRASA